VESPSLEIFKTRLDVVLCSLLWVTLLRQGVWTRWPTEVPSNPNHSVILREVQSCRIYHLQPLSEATETAPPPHQYEPESSPSKEARCIIFLLLLENKMSPNEEGMKLRSLTRNAGKGQISLNFAEKSYTSFEQDGEPHTELKIFSGLGCWFQFSNCISKQTPPKRLMLCLVEPSII